MPASFRPFLSKRPEAVLKAFGSRHTGLLDVEAADRLQNDGPNELKNRQVRALDIWLRQFRSAFVYLLVLAAAIGFALGDLLESSLILAFVLINSSLGFYQEYQSARALSLLKKFIQPNAKVRRGGRELLIPTRELVTGDLLLLKPGDLLAADVRLLETHELTIDESILTGESVAVQKQSDAIAAADAITKASNLAFTGTTVLRGTGLGLVIATGSRTELGAISHLTVETERVSSFEKGINAFSHFILRLIVVTLIAVFIFNLFLKGAHANIGELLIFSIALAVSVIPEALPIVTTISLSQGALRLAKRHVVVKRLSAIEDLGGIEILCSDKTGTLTENHLTVVDQLGENPLETMALAAEWNPDLTQLDPFDRALWEQLDAKTAGHLRQLPRRSAIPFDPARRRNSVVIEKNGKRTLIVRGAPETLFTCCAPVSAEQRSLALAWASNQGTKGRRVLAVAQKTGVEETCAPQDECELAFLGLVAFEDPLKATAPHAIAMAKKLGVQVKILTGDSLEVAAAAALQTGLINDVSEAMAGDTFQALSAEAQRETAKRLHVFARLSPEQKFHLIQLLEEGAEVGFLGEGINDAPALKVANIGLAVPSASDVARDAADIILLNPSLEVVVNGIRLGRSVFANTTKYIKTTLTSNFGNFFAVASASLLVNYLPMLPIQLLLLNLLSDFPMITISTDNVDNEELRRPKHYQVRDIALLAIALGAVSTVFDFLFFGLYRSHPPAVLQTNWFIGSILTELALVYSIRTRRFFLFAKAPSAWVTWLTTISAALAIALPFTDFGHRFFSFVTPRPRDLVTVLAVTLTYFATTETVKLLFVKFQKSLKTTA
jgi:Mg2+-importing ATPase